MNLLFLIQNIATILSLCYTTNHLKEGAYILEKNSNHILYTADRTYFPHMLTSIYSLLENNPTNRFIIHVIEKDFTKKEDKMLEILQGMYPNVEIQVYSSTKISKMMRKFNIPKWRGTEIANARLFFHELAPEINKLLYLDSDTVVVNSLDSLFNKELTKALAAVKNFEIPDHIKEHAGFIKNYYNSGVLLFNYVLLEQEDYLKKIYEYAKQDQIPLKYPDQDLINLALSERIEPLSINYNIHPLAYQLKNIPLYLEEYIKSIKKCMQIMFH